MMFKKNFSIFVIILLLFSSLIYAQETTPETTLTTQPEQETPTTTITETLTTIPTETTQEPAPSSEPLPPKEIDVNQLPPGCHLEKNEFSEFVKCEDKFTEDFRAREKERCEKFNGRFNIREDGSVECIVEGSGGFTGMKCPSEDELKRQSEICPGNLNKFIDRNGCQAISCEFKENFRERIREEHKGDDVKVRILECQSRDGEYVFIRGKPECFERREEIRVPERLRQLEPEDLLDIALKIEDIIIRLESIADKIERILEYYEEKGEKERGAGFEAALSRLEGAIARLEEIKLGLSQMADSLTDEDRKQVIIDIKSIKQIIRDVAIDILSGGRAESRSRGSSAEIDFSSEIPRGDFMTAIKHCDEFSKDKPYEFSPESETLVRLLGLNDDSKCIFNLHLTSKSFGGEARFLLPAKAYQFFNGPQTLFSDDVKCEPEKMCIMMKEKFADFVQDTKQRFGEREFREKFKNGEFEKEREFKERFKESRSPEDFKGISPERFEEYRESFEKKEFNPEDFERQQKELYEKQKEFYEQQKERFEEENKDEKKDDFIIENALEKYGDEFREEEK